MRLLPPCGAASPSSSAPWSQEDLARLNSEVEAAEEAALGQSWRDLFAHDMGSLYRVGDADEAEWAAVLQQLEKLPKSQWEESDLPMEAVSFSPTLVNRFIGMGTWRIRDLMHPVVQYLAQSFEGTWREAFVDDLCLYPAPKWKDRYDIIDSMDPARELEGWSYADVPHPRKGEEGYPRLLVENRVYSSRVFRKLHVELAWRQDGMQVLHVVMYPRYKMDMPILALDLVMFDGEVTLAIVDACPIRKNMELPAHYLQTMLELQAEFLPEEDATNRRIPDWGKNIFSPACVCIRPTSAAHLAGFLKYAASLHRVHCALATLVSPLDPQNDARHRVRYQALLEGHKSFVDNQLANKKTSRVLEQAFGKEWTDGYMSGLMFDYDPSDEPRTVDSSLVELFNYFELNPELGSRPEEYEALVSEAAVQRAEETLMELAAGKEVRQDNVEKALKALFVHDPAFRDNCLTLLPALGEVPPEAVGAFLAEQLEELGLSSVKRWVDKPLAVGAVEENEE